MAQQAAQNISSDVYSGVNEAESLKSRLETTKDLAEQVFNFTLPSLEYVEQLASSINASILSDEQVAEILANATASNLAAQQALVLARNAR